MINFLLAWTILGLVGYFCIVLAQAITDNDDIKIIIDDSVIVITFFGYFAFVYGVLCLINSFFNNNKEIKIKNPFKED